MSSPKFHRLDPGQRRDQILDAANALFAERGYDEVSIEDIASSPVSPADSCTTTSAAARRSTSRCWSGSAPSARNSSGRPSVAAPARGWRTRSHAGSTGPRPTARSASPRSRPARTSPTPTSARRRRPGAPRRRAARGLSRRHRRGLAAAAPRAGVLDRPQPRRDATLAARRGHPRGDPRTARLHARTRPAHVRRATRAKPTRIPSLRARRCRCPSRFASPAVRLHSGPILSRALAPVLR